MTIKLYRAALISACLFLVARSDFQSQASKSPAWKKSSLLAPTLFNQVLDQLNFTRLFFAQAGWAISTQNVVAQTSDGTTWTLFVPSPEFKSYTSVFFRTKSAVGYPLSKAPGQTCQRCCFKPKTADEIGSAGVR